LSGIREGGNVEWEINEKYFIEVPEVQIAAGKIEGFSSGADLKKINV